MSEQIKISHALRVLSRVTRMKGNEFICDFTIKVGGKSFPTHRTVLAASSDYFEALFNSKMKEATQGFVEMKGLGVKGVQHSLEFMYTGNAQITLESVDDILHAADLFQLDGLKTLCSQYMTQNLTPTNCLEVANLAQKYDLHDIRSESERVVISNFKLVISFDMFPLMTRSDLLVYISKVDHQTSWQAAVTWAKDKDEFPELVDAMDIQKFPFKFLWETVLAEPLVKQSETIKNKVIKRLFLDKHELRENLVMENCVLFKTLARERNIADATIKVITQFIEENFEDLTSQRTFNCLNKDDLLSLLESPSTKCSSEEVKWEAALNWVKYDSQQRKKAFLDIFSLIKLEKLPLAFLRDRVRSETLVEESRKCSNKLMDVVFAKSTEMEEGRAKNQLAGTQAVKSSSNSPTDISKFELGAASLPVVMDVLVGKAKALMKDSKFSEAVELLEHLPPTQGQQMKLMECYFQRNRNSDVLKCIENMKTLVVRQPRPKAVDLYNLGLENFKKSSHIKAMTFFACAAKIFLLQSNADESVRGVTDCSRQCYFVIEAMMKQNERMRILACDVGMEIMNGFVDDATSVENSDPDEKADMVARCQCYTGVCYHHLKNYQMAIEIYKRGIDIMNRQFGGNSSKYEVFGHLLNNMGEANENPGNYSEAETWYKQAIDAYKRAEDWGNDEMKKKNIEMAENNLRNTRSKTKNN